MITRRVNHTGTINWASEQLFVSSSLAGWSVGLKPVEHQQLEVWFARLLLGWIDPKTVSFRRAAIVPKMQREAKTPKTNAGPWSRLAATRDLPTIAFSRADPLLRRHGPVPGIQSSGPARGDYGEV
jgi:hypothetical protein